jgi:hypothetical protein
MRVKGEVAHGGAGRCRRGGSCESGVVSDCHVCAHATAAYKRVQSDDDLHGQGWVGGVGSLVA